MMTLDGHSDKQGQPERRCSAFAGPKRIASGSLRDVALATKAVLDQGEDGAVLIFDDITSRPVEIDFRGTAEDVLKRVRALSDAGGSAPDTPAAGVEPPRGPGRPRLGVVAREVTLLPRHWEWLNTQPGGASGALRRLVDEARRSSGGRDRVRQAQESAYRFMSAMAGNERGFEEAIRALFAGQRQRFDECVATWPGDVRAHAGQLAAGAFTNTVAPELEGALSPVSGLSSELERAEARLGRRSARIEEP